MHLISNALNCESFGIKTLKFVSEEISTWLTFNFPSGYTLYGQNRNE